MGVFKPRKSHFSNACRRYLAANPGQVITADVLARLLDKAWSEAVTPVNVMNGFKRCGINSLPLPQVRLQIASWPHQEHSYIQPVIQSLQNT